MTAVFNQFKQPLRYSVSALLALSSGLLTVLVPGGPIETRSFAHIDPLVLGSFNTFLTTLSLTSLLLAYFVWQRQRWVIIMSGLYGFFYFLVYVLDLVQLFPVSPDAMPLALFGIEVSGTVVSLPLMALSLSALRLDEAFPQQVEPVYGGKNNLKLFSLMAMGFALIGVGIIIFATRAAMGI